MARFQILTTDENDGGNACEALWYDWAAEAMAAGHEVSAFVTARATRHPRLIALAHAGLRLHPRWSEPKSGRVLPLAHKVWQRSGARLTAPRRAGHAADFRLLNVGTMIEAAREPWFTVLTRSPVPYGIVVHNNPEIRDYPPALRRKLRHVLHAARRVYFVSQRLWTNAEEQVLESIPGARVVRNPVNLRSREIEPWPAEKSCLRLAVVARLDAFVKGHVRLMHALAGEPWRSRPWQLSFFGSGPDRATIEKAAAFYGLSDRVKFRGFVDDVRAAVWRSHHLLVMPSMLEGMPLTLVEAMVCGRPALCSDVGGASELIRDGTNGFLAGSPFAAQLAQGLDRAWNHRQTLQAMGAIAHEDALRFLPANPGARLLEDVVDAIGPS